jgi:hypothetical protein
VEKRLGTEYWTNVYHVQAADQAVAQAAANNIVSIERGLHYEVVEITKYRLSPYPGPSEGTVYPINVFGLAGPAGDMLPLFNVVRADFPAPVGRPSRKYYRGALTEGDQANGNLVEARAAAVQTALARLGQEGDLAAALVDVDGQALADARVSRLVGMRQLRRGSRRRLAPII